jgi:tRNA-binding protein
MHITEEKEIVSKEETFDKLDIRLGRVISVEEELSAPKKAYKLKIDFGKFGIKTSVGRFTQHAPEEIKGKLVLGIKQPFFCKFDLLLLFPSHFYSFS